MKRLFAISLLLFSTALLLSAQTEDSSRAMDAYFEGDYALAAELAEELDDKTPTIFMLLARSYSRTDRKEDAVRCYREVLDSIPFHTTALSEVSALLFEEEDYEQAAHFARNLVSLKPDSEDGNRIAGLSLFRLDSLELSQPYLKKALENNEEDIDLTIALAASYLWDDNDFNPESEFLFQKAEVLAQTDPKILETIHAGKARGYYNNQDWAESLHHYELALGLSPQNYSYYSKIGYCHEQLEQYEKAKLNYEKYLASATPGTREYEVVQQNLEYVNLELFMDL